MVSTSVSANQIEDFIIKLLPAPFLIPSISSNDPCVVSVVDMLLFGFGFGWLVGLVFFLFVMLVVVGPLKGSIDCVFAASTLAKVKAVFQGSSFCLYFFVYFIGILLLVSSMIQ